MSLGLGFKGNVCRQVYMNLAVGFPLERDVNGNRVSKARVHFAMNAQF
jgi:hemolysin activation/secretion protein